MFSYYNYCMTFQLTPTFAIVTKYRGSLGKRLACVYIFCIYIVECVD